MGSATAPRVFISYASSDRPRAVALAERLEATGVVVWLLLGGIGLVALAALLAFVFTLFSGAGLGRAVRGPGWGGGYVPGGWGGGGLLPGPLSFCGYLAS